MPVSYHAWYQPSVGFWLGLPVLLTVLLGSAAPAHATCDTREADALRAHLTAQAARGDTWNTAWRWSLTGASAAAFAVALADPIPSLRDGLYVTSGKAAIAAAGRWALPLRIALAGTEKTRSRGER